MTATSPLVSKRVADANPTHHQHILGMGYLAHSGAPDLPDHCKGEENCAPPQGTANASLHLLKPPGGAPDMIFKWAAKHNAWLSISPGKGNRMAWTVDHLMKAGWRYVGPKPDDEPEGE